jgi:hypothetical protein
MKVMHEHGTSASTTDNISGGNFDFSTDASRRGCGVQLGINNMLPSRAVLGIAADMSSGGTKTTAIADPSGISANQTSVISRVSVPCRNRAAATRRMRCYAQGVRTTDRDLELALSCQVFRTVQL